MFKVPLKGDFPTLLAGVLIYVTAMTAYGMLISAFTRTQIAAVNRRPKLTPYRRPKLTPLVRGSDGSARPGGAGRGCAAGASAVR